MEDNHAKSILLILLCLIISSKVWATAQVPDYLIYKGDTLFIYSNPLESYFIERNRPTEFLGKLDKNLSTACWRGYIAYWELRNDSLFLVEIKNSGTKEIIDLSIIFKDRDTTLGVFADWYTSSIMQPFGKLVHYIHDGYKSLYEYEKEFVFEKGILQKTEIYDNSKYIKSEYSRDYQLLKNFIKENIDYSNLPEFSEIKKVIVLIKDVNENGKITEVEIIRGNKGPFDKEAERVIKSIPQWDVLFKQGKLFHIRYTIPVIFEPRS